MRTCCPFCLLRMASVATFTQREREPRVSWFTRHHTPACSRCRLRHSELFPATHPPPQEALLTVSQLYNILTPRLSDLMVRR
jgi:hypothetical protein